MSIAEAVNAACEAGVQSLPAKPTPPFAALRAFDAFARTGSLRRAARDLGIDHAAVSRHIRSLETWVGVLLVERASGGGRLTLHGERYFRRVSAALSEISSATAEIMEPEVGAPLRILCGSSFGSNWLAHRLGEFGAENPELDIEVQPCEAKPNFTCGKTEADIRFMVGRRTPERAFNGVKCVELARPLVVAAASPEFLARHPPVRELADLLTMPLLHLKDDWYWRSWLDAQGLPRVRRLPGLRLCDTTLTKELARSGHGVVLTNTILLKNDLESGRLITVDVGGPVSNGAYFFTTRVDRWQSPPLVRLRRWLQGALAA